MFWGSRKLREDFQLQRELVPLTHPLFNGQLYFYFSTKSWSKESTKLCGSFGFNLTWIVSYLHLLVFNKYIDV